MASRFTLPHIDITPFGSAQEYQGTGSGGGPDARARAVHGARLSAEFAAALAVAEALRPKDDRLPPVQGAFVEVELRPGAKPDALDAKREGIRSGAAKLGEHNERIVPLYVPDAARAAFEQILQDYLNGPLSEKGNPPNQAKVEAINAFRQIHFESFWTDDPAAMPHDKFTDSWWGLWCWPDKEGSVIDACEKLGVRVAGKDHRQYFPETVVIPVFANRITVELLLYATGAIGEVRRGGNSPAFFADAVTAEQIEWVDDLAERIVWPAGDAPTVCLFDTGVNRGHSLIEPALAERDMQAIRKEWGVDDSGNGHGTAMAGLALYGDLTAPLGDRSERKLSHRLESVKLLPPAGFDPTDPHNYGPVTQAAIALPEIVSPFSPRVFCLALTNMDVSGSAPSGWSAAVDQAAAGTMPGDDKDAPRRLIVIAAGNAKPEIEAHRILHQDEYPIEDPAQAWNALTVGGYTDRCVITEKGYGDWTPMAEVGSLSPHSRTSATWPINAPIKPEIVLEAGNRAVSPSRKEIHTVGSLGVCTTGHDAKAPLVPFQATSAAAAQAARLAARLTADHPEFWPETVRGLIVHSAEWTEAMVSEIDGKPGKKDRKELVRRFGYGVPDYERATASARHHLALFAQSEIQPFKFKGGRNFNECHYYDIPLPGALLEKLNNDIVELKLTLSYFIDPNPGGSANIDPYRYQSHGLRFDLRRKAEPLADFKKRVNANERDDPRVRPPLVADDARWVLGPQSISAGSLHCDKWIGPAIELLGRDTLCIYPVGGWCRKRSSAEICDTKRRYSLILTFKSHDVEVDLYTPIMTLIEPPVEIDV